SADVFYLTIAPESNQNGSSNITITATDEGGLTAIEVFTLTVDSVNDSPSISSIVDQTTSEDITISSIDFTVSDIETAGCDHGINIQSSDTSLIPIENITYSCSADVFSLTITPANNQNGSSIITITATDDGGLNATGVFTLTVDSVNDAPSISSIVDQTTNENTTISSIDFTVSDIETAGCDHSININSSDTYLVPIENITYSCSADVFYLTITPATSQSGSSIITITATDEGGLTATEVFTLTVDAVNDAPSISSIIDQTTSEDITISSIDFTVSDIETAGCDHAINIDSSDTNLVPIENITYSCSADVFYLTITPATSQSGSSIITIRATDEGGLNSTEVFTLRVDAVNDSPSISSIVDQTTNEDTTISAIEFTVSDIETAGCDHGINIQSSDTNLIPIENITYSCSADVFSLSIAPASNQNGSSNITITATDDGGLNTTEVFTLTVDSVNDTPSISSIADQTTSEDITISSIDFTVSDIETAGCDHGINIQSSDTNLIPI
ncbi:hypothetical protein MHK_004830, partial [Candidatus Magnetomorum sp. HK-1]